MATYSPPPPVVSQVPLAWDKSTYLAVVIDNMFSEKECKDLIARAEHHGYEKALVNIGGGQQMRMDGVRNNDRCIIDDSVVAAKIWKRIQEALEQVDSDRFHDLRLQKLSRMLYNKAKWHAVGLNERLRILRYDPGTWFKKHMDGSYVRNNEAGTDRHGEMSFVTCQLYLNEGFEGGTTRFYPLDETASRDTEYHDVVPKTGSVVLFEHDLLHEGMPVVSGRKSVIRTDVMYTNKGPGHEYTVHPIAPPLSTTRPKSAENLQEL